jgi:hypothetical protein
MHARAVLFFPLCVFVLACGSQPAPQAEVPAAKAPTITKPADETRRFPMDGREAVEVVEDQLLGKEYLPGGNIATYKKGGKTWRQFVIKANDPGQTAILLGRIKDGLKDPKFVAHMGGYFGMDGTTTLFAFPKGRWIAGVTGLPEKDADTAGRQMALRLD